jgi:hypothetical protein
MKRWGLVVRSFYFDSCVLSFTPSHLEDCPALKSCRSRAGLAGKRPRERERKGERCENETPSGKGSTHRPRFRFQTDSSHLAAKKQRKRKKEEKKKGTNFGQKLMYVHAVARTARRITVLLVAVCFTVKITRQ